LGEFVGKPRRNGRQTRHRPSYDHDFLPDRPDTILNLERRKKE